jgi:DNA ligase (NAD+)
MPGCRILVSKRNMIIPHVEENLDRGRFNAIELFPVSCPSCNSRTRIKETGTDKGRIIRILRCIYTDCKAQRLRRFVHFVSKKAMNIEGLSEATLEKFINLGFLNDSIDIYRLGEHEFEITSLEGFGKKSWRRLWDAIQRSRNTTFERYLISMDIPMIGRTASKELSRRFNSDLDKFEDAVAGGFDFTQLKDFGETLNRNIHEWFSNAENLYLWKELQKMTTIEKKKAPATSVSTGNPFVDCTIVVTGKLALFTRSTINAKIETLGAKAGSAISKNTDYLICGDKAGSKLDKARSLGVKVLSEQEFLNMAQGA